MNVLETEWWTMAVPPEWWAEAEEDSILVGDRDEVGVLEFSNLRKDEGDFSRQEIQQIAQSESESGRKWERCSVGEFSGLVSSLVEEGAAIREWYLGNGPLLLFVTYCCDLDNAGMDDAAVDEILDTLMIVSAEE